MTDGTRSGLWSHMVKAIDTLRPGLVVIENVGGLFSAQADSRVEPCDYHLGDADGGGHTVLLRALDSVLGTLATLGYDAEWVALRAADVGAPHGRLRVFITAHPSGGGSGGRAALPLASGTGGADTPPHRAGAGPDAPGNSPELALLPTPVVTDSFGARNETSGRKEGSQHHSGRTLGDVAWLDAWGEYGPAIHHWERVLGRPAPDPTEPGKTRPRLSSRFVEWLMGLDDGHVTGVGLTRNQELKALGNGVVPQQGSAALLHLHTIRTTYLEEMTS